MKRTIFLILTVAAMWTVTIAQPAQNAKSDTDKTASVANSGRTANDFAKNALAAHGGDKLKKVRSLVLKGTVDLNVMGQAMPGAFSTAFSGDKYFFEINSVMQSLKQVYDGHQTYSSLNGFSLPPVTSLGFPLLMRLGDTGFVVAELGGEAKKKKGFRITSPEGFYTDFFIDDKTGQIKGYESSYDVEGKIITTSVAIDSYQTVDGVTVPSKYSQRFDLGQLTAYANFNTKTVLVNSPIEDTAFALPVK